MKHFPQGNVFVCNRFMYFNLADRGQESYYISDYLEQ